MAFTNVEGVHWFFFTGDGYTVLHQPTPTEMKEVILKYAYICAIYWDSTNQVVVLNDVFDERHGSGMNPVTHYYLHRTQSAKFIKGFQLGDFNIGLGTANTNSQFTISEGEYVDEDMSHFGNDTVIGDTIPVTYLSGASLLRYSTQAGYGVLNAPTNGRLYYNQLVGVNYQLTEVTNNKYCLYHEFAINGQNVRYASVMGQSEYLSIAAARLGANSDITNVRTGLALPEIIPLASIIFQTRNTNFSTATTWTRVGTTVTVTAASHGLLTGETIIVTAIAGSQTTGNKVVTVLTDNTFSFVGVNTSNASGAITFTTIAFTNATKSRIVLNDEGTTHVNWTTTELAQGAAPTSHANLTDVQQAGVGVSQGHISDQAQSIYGVKTFESDAVFKGNITQSIPGTIEFVNELQVADSIIYTRQGAATALGVGEFSGIQTINYDGLGNNLNFGVDEDGWARVGDAGGTFQKIATIEESPTNGFFAYYDSTAKQLKTKSIASTDLTNGSSVMLLGSVQTVTGAKTFAADTLLKTGTELVTNLNADKVDGYDFNQALLTTSSPTFASIKPSNLTTNYLTKQTANGLGNSVVYEDVNGNVGIGTATSPEKITVAGNMELTEGANRYIKMGSQSNYWYNLQSVGDDFQILEAGDINKVRLHIDFPNGNIGIGTTNPVVKLDSRGTSDSINPLSSVPNGSAWIGGVGTGAGLNIGNYGDDYIWLQGRNELAYAGAYPIVINPLGGNVGIGTTIVPEKLTVGGNILATQYKLSALNTAPSSATDTGTTGEIRVTATHIYVCTATNTWVRTALATW